MFPSIGIPSFSRALHAGLASLFLVSTLANPSFNEFSEKQASAAQVIAEDDNRSELQLLQELKSRDDRSKSPLQELVRDGGSTHSEPGGIPHRVQLAIQPSLYAGSLLYTQTTSSDL